MGHFGSFYCGPQSTRAPRGCTLTAREGLVYIQPQYIILIERVLVRESKKINSGIPLPLDPWTTTAPSPHRTIDNHNTPTP
jgi:hypothetical protein